MIHIGKVKRSAIAVNAQAARNFAMTACPMVTGNVIKSSIVPVLRSSAHSRIETAGIRNKYSQGWKLKNPWRSARSCS